jgi:hypothetical protein
MLTSRFVKSPAKEHAAKAPSSVVAIGDTCLGEQGMARIGESYLKYHVCSANRLSFTLQTACNFLPPDEGIR